jgi:hypothetical protein
MGIKGVTSAMVFVKERGVAMVALVVVGVGFRDVEVEVEGEEEVGATPAPLEAAVAAAFWAK